MSISGRRWERKLIPINRKTIMVFPWVMATFMCTYFGTLVVEFMGRRRAIFSKASHRRKRLESVPLLGGIGIFLGAVLGVIAVDLDFGGRILLSAMPIVVMGVIDDLIEIPGRTKLIGQFGSATLFLLLFPKSEIFFHALGLPPFMGILLTFSFLVGITNAFNLIDGMDGLCATSAITLWGALALVNPVPAFPWIMIAATSAFLLRNLPPAQIYLGEVGSAFLGFSLGAFALHIHNTPTTWSHFIGILFLFSVPFADTVAAMGRRWLHGQSIFHGDREHIHHRLLKLQFRVPQALVILNVMFFGGGMTYVLSTRLTNLESLVGLYLLAGSLLTTLFFGVFYCERHFSQRLVGMGRSLLAKHFLRVSHSGLMEAPRRALLIDLMPYFRELQSQGIVTVSEFLDDLAELIQAMGDRNKIEFFGSYSLALLNAQADIWSLAEKKVICAQLNQLFTKYHCARWVSEIPEGLTFYDNDELPRLLRLSGEGQSVEKAAS